MSLCSENDLLNCNVQQIDGEMNSIHINTNHISLTNSYKKTEQVRLGFLQKKKKKKEKEKRKKRKKKRKKKKKKKEFNTRAAIVLNSPSTNVVLYFRSINLQEMC